MYGTPNAFGDSTFGESWSQFLEIHDTVGSVHLKLSNVVAELSEDLSTLQKDSERSRKQVCYLLVLNG